MLISGVFDFVVKKLDLLFFEVFIGWKFFGNLMDVGKFLVCGEESFGIGFDYIREKDGIWVVFVWFNILVYKNRDV